MPTRKIDTGAMREAFRYAPGDGHIYRQQVAGADITVHRIITGDILTDEPTGDTIPAPASVSAEALMAQVDGWRQAR